MRQKLRSHLTYANVISTLALFLVLGGGTTLAATGGNFILGKSNTAGTPTQLSSPTTNAAGALRVANTNTTTAGRGISAVGGAGGYGLYASGGNRSKGTAAIHGQSGAGNAVEGFSTANPASGVFGQDNRSNSYGVAGHSDNGVAVVGDSSGGWAMQALGNTTQTRTANGFVKARRTSSPVRPIRFGSASTPSFRRARQRAETAASPFKLLPRASTSALDSRWMTVSRWWPRPAKESPPPFIRLQPSSSMSLRGKARLETTPTARSTSSCTELTRQSLKPPGCGSSPASREILRGRCRRRTLKSCAPHTTRTTGGTWMPH
jgi:hypothetical protein